MLFVWLCAPLPGISAPMITEGCVPGDWRAEMVFKEQSGLSLLILPASSGGNEAGPARFPATRRLWSDCRRCVRLPGARATSPRHRATHLRAADGKGRSVDRPAVVR